MHGLVDLTGEKCGTLHIQRMVARKPEPRYAVVCERCGTESTATHSRLRNGAARCLAANCGKPERPRRSDSLSDQLRVRSEREAERLAERREASVLRMEAEVAGWELPTKTTPSPAPYLPKSERERLERRERLEAEEAERRAEEAPRLEAERRAAEEREAAESSQRERDEKKRNYWTEWVQSDPDPKLYVTPELRTVSMSKSKADDNNSAEVQKFIEANPAYSEYKSSENADKLLAYFVKNGVNIFDAAMLRAAFVRLRDLGILEKRPAPQPQPQPVERPNRVNLSVREPFKPSTGPKVYKGRDYVTGLERDFTQREVDRMSALEYERAFDILPTFSKLFTAMRESR